MDEPTDRKAEVLKLLKQAAPERGAELDGIMATLQPQFIEDRDVPGLHFHAMFTIIRYNERALRIKWLLGYAAWRSIQAYSGVIAWLDHTRGSPLERPQIEAMPEQAEYSAKCQDLIAKATELSEAASLEDFPWPADIPRLFQPPTKVEDRATYDLVKMAIGFSFLHEMKHAILYDAGTPPGGPQEEHDCDQFAADFMRRHITVYTGTSREDPEKVLFKRSLAIALGCYIVASITPPDNRGGTETHPAVGERLRTLCVGVQLPPSSHYWVSLASFILSLLEGEGRVPQRVDYADMKDLAIKLAALV